MGVFFWTDKTARIIMNQPADAPGRCLLGSLGQRSTAGRATDTKSQAAIVISEWKRRTEDLLSRETAPESHLAADMSK